MPVSGLPLSLEDLLESVTQKCTVKSWQIYSEKDGVTFRIKFGQFENGAQMAEGNVGYAKKPPSKIARDKDRVTQRITRSKSKKLGDIERPRFVDDSPDNYDSTNSAQRPYSHVGLIQTPVSVHDPNSPELSGHANYVISPGRHAPLGQDINTSMLPDAESMSVLDNTGDQEILESDMNNQADSSVDLSHATDQQQESDTESLSDSDTSVTPGCNVQKCHYRDMSAKPVNTLAGIEKTVICTKCPGTKIYSHMYICETCNYTHHRHQRHKQYHMPVRDFFKLGT